MNREKAKSRFNFIDAIIIVIILAIIGAAIFLIVTDVQHQKHVKSAGNMDFTVRISEVPADALSLFATGNVVKDSKNGEVLGEIVSIRSEKTKYYSKKATTKGGTYEIVTSEYADKYDVYVTCKATAKHDESHDIYTVGNNKILIGAPIYLKIPSFTSVAFVTDFNIGAAVDTSAHAERNVL